MKNVQKKPFHATPQWSGYYILRSREQYKLRSQIYTLFGEAYMHNPRFFQQYIYIPPSTSLGVHAFTTSVHQN